MRKLNYNIGVGTIFKLPQMSWQFPYHALGMYQVKEKIDDGWEINYRCSMINKTAPELIISEMCLAYLLGDEVPAEINVEYLGTEYQPTNHDPHPHYASEDGDVDNESPFWYFGCRGSRNSVDCQMNTEKWCYYSLPWD